MNILQKIQLHYQKNLPFVAYKKPNEILISAFFQQTDEVFHTENYTESGFVFAPFDDKKKAVLIPENESFFFKDKVDLKEFVNNEEEVVINKIDKELHQEIVDKAIQKIVNNKFRKVVLSRKEEVALVRFDIVETFTKLVSNYPTAMVYVWFHPKVGLWLGATPETLVNVSGNEFETMSLAGTQVDKGVSNAIWKPKELDEQQVVTDYILEKLEPICKQVSAQNVETIKAGNLLHLRTKITGILSAKNSQLITCLHPTPAVCGFPKNETKKYILKNENYDREFYTGFLGELNVTSGTKHTSSNLYVNLRCMQIKDQKVFIYVGGGITKDSNSIKEWEETVAKSQTMRRVL